MRLMTPFHLGPLELRNRIVLAAMVRNYGQDGYVTQRLVDHYARIAAGGCAVLTVEATSVDPTRSLIFGGQLFINDDRYIPKLRSLADALREHGAYAFLQLHHAGERTRRDLIKGQAVGPSSRDEDASASAAELTTDEIAEIVAMFAAGAARARKAGFDGVELSAGHGYLINQFLSSAWNKRRDAYGGSLERRARFLLQIVAAVKTAAGDAYPLVVRINCEEADIDGGNDIRDAVQIASMLEDAGVDAINVSGMSPVRSYYSPPAYFEYGAAEIRKHIKITVIASGGIDSDTGEKILRQGEADLVALGRPLLADPELPAKLAAGRADEIRPCIMCMYCQDCLLYEDGPLGCAVNPAVGREREYALVPASKAKRVVVVGGGPAGMAAAYVAGARGHYVTLFEKEPVLGGLLNLASLPPGKESLAWLRESLARQMEAAGVEVLVGKTVSVTELQETKPEAVILATGSVPIYPRILGDSGGNVVTFDNVLTGDAEVGDGVIVVGGGRSGCETADFLAKRRRRVTIVEMLDALMKEARPSRSKELLVDELAKDGVEVLVNTRAEKAGREGLEVATEDGSRKVLIADTVVLAAGLEPNRALYEAASAAFAEVYSIGDCVSCGLVTDAVASAYETAMKI